MHVLLCLSLSKGVLKLMIPFRFLQPEKLINTIPSHLAISNGKNNDRHFYILNVCQNWKYMLNV